MSICIDVITTTLIQPDEILDAFVEKGSRIKVVHDAFPHLRLGEMNQAVRGIEINEEDNGYEIRICVGSSESDYRLFRQAIEIVSTLTGGMIFSEEGEKIVNVSELFDDAWIEQQMRNDCKLLYSAFRPSGEAIILEGLFAPICLGFQILSSEGKNMWNPDYEKYKSMLEYLAIIQTSVSNAKLPPHHLVVKNKENDKETMGITAIHISNNQVTPFDFVPYNPLLAFIDEDRDHSIIIPFKKLRYISLNRGLHMFDDYQCGKCLASMMRGDTSQAIAEYDVRDMMDDAKRYELTDLFFKPTYPGCGYDNQQRTYVLTWNPDSRCPDMSEEEFRASIANMWSDKYDLIWDISDCRSIRMGDRFFVVRNGQETSGIVMSGIFGSHSYFDHSKKCFWADLVFNFAVDYNVHPIITIEQLKSAIPDYDWSRTFGTNKLKVGQAKIMEKLFAPYFNTMKEKADGKTINATHYLL